MLDYFNSTRRANQVLARIAKTAFAYEETKPFVECQRNSSSLDSGKIILRLSKLNSTKWKVWAPLDSKKTGSLDGNIITLDDISNHFRKSSKVKIAKKRKLNDEKFQVQKGRTDDAKIPYKKCHVNIKIKKSSKKGDVNVNCESKNSIRRSKRLVTKAENKQKVENSAETNFNSSAIVSHFKRKNSNKHQSYLKANPQKRIQYLRSSSNVSS